MHEAQKKFDGIFPKVRRNPEGRTEFESLTDLVQYLIEEDKRKMNATSVLTK